jgi:Peptidase inhibitor family I36
MFRIQVLFVSVLGLLVSVLGLSAALPATASAGFYWSWAGSSITDAKPSSCPPRRLCLYKDANFRGTKSIRAEKDNQYYPWSHFENGENINDKVSSVFNSSPWRVKRLFRDSFHKNHVICLNPDTGIADLGRARWTEGIPGYSNFIDKSMNDRISSHSSHEGSIDNLHCNWRAR